jgi:hypothetical protein
MLLKVIVFMGLHLHQLLHRYDAIIDATLAAVNTVFPTPGFANPTLTIVALAVLLGTGTGAFDAGGQTSPLLRLPVALTAADLDGDADLDIDYLFLGGAPPLSPGPPPDSCGPDPDAPGSPGSFGCESYDRC